MKGHKMSEKRTQWSFRPSADELETIWANRLDQDQLIENLTGYYKDPVMVASLNIKDIEGKKPKAEATRLFAEIAQVANLDLSVESGYLRIVRPQTRQELIDHAKYVLGGEIAAEAYRVYEMDLKDQERDYPDNV